jgi:hypothetical protein
VTTFTILADWFSFIFSGVGHRPLVILAAVDGQVVWVVAEVADVAKGVAPDRETGARWLVANPFIPIVTDVDERQPFGPLGG